MPHALTLGLVVLVGLYLVALAAVALVAPRRAAGFLLGFAASARVHYLELALRGVAGGAFLIQAPRLPYPSAFSYAGGMLLLTTAGLAVLPWRWHRAFAQRAVPYATRHLPLVGVASFLLGALVLIAAFTGRTT
jgi:hypothetical protein